MNRAQGHGGDLKIHMLHGRIKSLVMFCFLKRSAEADRKFVLNKIENTGFEVYERERTDKRKEKA